MVKIRNKRYIGFGIGLLCILALLAAWGYLTRSSTADKMNPYVREYVIGAAGIQGTVDVSQWGEHPAYAIGADREGYAVFKDPDKAFGRMKTDYAKGLKAIQQEFALRPVSMANYQQYGTYGWQLTKTEDAEAVEQAGRVTSFMDIFENSYVK